MLELLFCAVLGIPSDMGGFLGGLHVHSTDYETMDR